MNTITNIAGIHMHKFQVYVYANDTAGWRRADDADVVIDKMPALYAASIAVGATAYEIW